MLNRIRPLLLVLAVLAAVPVPAQGPTPPEDPARRLPLLLRTLDSGHRVLYVTAHPDDEDAGLLARLAHVDGAHTALLTLTRGEGGQNEIGTELFDALGVLRSRELQAAGRYTGAVQYYSRAFEFGYSFSVEETFAKWGREAVLRDVVRVIRLERPDVILTLPDAGDGGGQHHQASAILAREAFDRAASTDWPELGEPHRAARLFRVVWGDTEPVHPCRMELGRFDPVAGASPEALGRRSRAQHKCQGMARLGDPLARRESVWDFVASADPVGDPPRPLDHLLEGLPRPVTDPVLRSAARDARDAFRPGNPAAVLPHLDRYRTALPDDGSPRWGTLRAAAAEAAQLAAGLVVEAHADRVRLAPGDAFTVTCVLENTGPDTIRVASLRLRDRDGRDVPVTQDIAGLALDPGAVRRVTIRALIDPRAASTLPRPMPRHGDDLEHEASGRHLRPAWEAFTLWVAHERAGRVDAVPVPVLRPFRWERFPTVLHGEPQVVPDPGVRPARETVPLVVRPGGATEASATVEFAVSSLSGGTVDVFLDAPTGWRVEPTVHAVETEPDGVETNVAFAVRPPPGWTPTPGEPRLRFRARAGLAGRAGRLSTSGYRRIEYLHIRPAALHVESTVDVVPVAVEVPPGRRVGYLAGTGDRLPEALRDLGLDAQVITEETVVSGDWSGFDVVILGVRAYKVREDLKANHAALLDWVAAGGHLVVQYNKLEFNDGADRSPYAPYPAAVGRRRVTVEEAPPSFPRPDHPVFRAPNALGPADWEGWVQERGLYFLDVFDERYRDLVLLEDPWPYNAGVSGGSLVTASVGRGRWTYVGLGLFRQLPAGVPGAYRLLANLVALDAAGR